MTEQKPQLRLGLLRVSAYLSPDTASTTTVHDDRDDHPRRATDHRGDLTRVPVSVKMVLAAWTVPRRVAVSAQIQRSERGSK